ncbi:MAG: hypothetical protein A3G24_18805 [Betaproteobacteria bacterium RIFCSPLOWO2_12_FULL_62_13]|nr:MAG: hypothetical protein A3G24_18805 [Betaproteobacteria bacterium RIFCSPLOWO2_12_FULL_62_13]
MPLSCSRRHWFLTHPSVVLLWFAIVLGCTPATAAQPVGEVIHVYGIASAQRAGEDLRFIQKGDPLNEGDVIETGGRGFAVIGLKDGSKMTLRPDTTFAIDKFSHDAKEESALFRLLKGGLRAVSGLIAKRNPQGVRVSTATATIGIRGTSFDARICGPECAHESRAAQKVAAAPQDSIVARVAILAGTTSAVGVDGQVRTISRGTPLFNGDTIRTQKDSYAVLAFRDRSVVTVIAESEFKLENVRFSSPRADSGNFIVRVVKGGARVLTGLLAKREPKTVQVNMITAIVGIRGTGVDGRLALDCVAGPCSEAAFAYTWQGAVALQVGERSLLIEMDRAGVYNPAQDRLALLDRVPEFFLIEPAPRPDMIEIDFDNLFGLIDIEEQHPGLYVVVREGHIELAAQEGSIDLGAGEAGYLGEGQLTPVRLLITPAFMLVDPYPLPDQLDRFRLNVLNPGGRPGDVICEM